MSDQIEQVGGTHYGPADGNGHWDLMERWNIGYLEATATKYIQRWKLKGTPVQDLEKALSYVRKVLSARRGVRGRVPYDTLQLYIAYHHMRDEEGQLFTLILNKGMEYDLKAAARILQAMIDRESSR